MTNIDIALLNEAVEFSTFAHEEIEALEKLEYKTSPEGPTAPEFQRLILSQKTSIK